MFINEEWIVGRLRGVRFEPVVGAGGFSTQADAYRWLRENVGGLKLVLGSEGVTVRFRRRLTLSALAAKRPKPEGLERAPR